MVILLIILVLIASTQGEEFNSGISFFRSGKMTSKSPFNAVCRVQVYYEGYGTLDVCIGMNIHPDKAIVNKECLDAFPHLNFTENLGLAHASSPVSWKEMNNLIHSPYIHRVLLIKHIAIGNGGHASILFHTGRDDNFIPITKRYPGIFDLIWAFGYGHPRDKANQWLREYPLQVEKTYKRPKEACFNRDVPSEFCVNRESDDGFISISNAGGPLIYDGEFVGFAKFSGLRWKYDKLYIAVHDFRPAYSEMQKILNSYEVVAPRYYGNMKRFKH